MKVEISRHVLSTTQPHTIPRNVDKGRSKGKDLTDNIKKFKEIGLVFLSSLLSNTHTHTHTHTTLPCPSSLIIQY